MPTDRLNRYLSRAAGVSRRTADEMIRMGRVTVGKKPVLDPGTLLDSSRGEVRIDGTLLLDVPEEKIYLMAHKPDSVVTTMKDKEGRKTAGSLVGELSSRVFPVGRLDYHTTGLLLFTNDGDTAHGLQHPSREVEREYWLEVAGSLSKESVGRLLAGVDLEDGVARAVRVHDIRRGRISSELHLVIAEGRKREVRRMMSHLGHAVMRLRRVRYGPVRLGGLARGSWRDLTPNEVAALRTAAAG